MLSHVRLFVTSLTVAHQAALSMKLSGKNAEVGCHFLLQGIFPTQRLNPHPLPLLHWQADPLPLTAWEALGMGMIVEWLWR